MKNLNEFKTKIFADGADYEQIIKLYNEGFIKGFTTNPTLMKKAGVACYETFAKKIANKIKDLPFSFEVTSDEPKKMEQEALWLSNLGENIYVKIPIISTKGESYAEVIRNLSARGVKINVTAVLTLQQVQEAFDAISEHTPAIISLFVGRIADTGRNYVSDVKESLEIIKSKQNIELLWASVREVHNIVEAEKAGCHIITVTDNLLAKTNLIGYDLEQLSIDTVKMFYSDIEKTGYLINTEEKRVVNV